MSFNVALAVIFAASVVLFSAITSLMVFGGRSDVADWLALTAAMLSAVTMLFVGLMSSYL